MGWKEGKRVRDKMGLEGEKERWGKRQKERWGKRQIDSSVLH